MSEPKSTAPKDIVIFADGTGNAFSIKNRMFGVSIKHSIERKATKLPITLRASVHRDFVRTHSWTVQPE
jgi:hypothetical protein